MNAKMSQESGAKSREKRRKPRRIKAVRGCFDASGKFVIIDPGSIKSPAARVRVAVIDISDKEALVEEATKALAYNRHLFAGKARAVLETLNIIPKRKGARHG